MAYTDIDKPSDYFETLFYTGNASSPRTISGVGFSPDLVWCKNRTTANDNRLVDQVRGANKEISSNRTLAEYSNNSDGNLTSFNSDGFVITQGSTNINNWNKNSDAYVVWSWKAGTSFTNDASGTGIGTIDSAGSVNQDAGFSICSYTGTGSAGTIKHGLNSTPSTIILKNRIAGDIFWYVYHKSLGNDTELYLNGNDAAPSSTSAWNDTNPTSSVFSVGSHGGTNASGQATIAYCFSEKQGYSKFGKYVGNNSTSGGFHYTGFKPSFIMIKRTDATADWRIYDDKRFRAGGPNNKLNYLEPNTSDAEADTDSGGAWDMLSNGFKFYTSEATINGSGTYIYMAFAEQPLVTSTGVPATAK